MFIDNVSLLLMGAASSYLIISGYLFFGFTDTENQGSWAAAFGIVGTMLTAGGFYVIWTWPLPGQFNMAYGEMSILLGLLMLGACLSLAREKSLLPLSIPAFFFGGTALIMAFGFYKMGLSQEPIPTAIGFAFSGLCGILAFLPLAYPKQKEFRLLGGLGTLLVGLFWAFNAYAAYYAHLGSFDKYLPPGMR